MGNKVYTTTWPDSTDKLVFDFSNFPTISILSDENSQNKNRTIILNFHGAKSIISDEAVNMIVAQSIDGEITIQTINASKE